MKTSKQENVPKNVKKSYEKAAKKLIKLQKNQ